MTDRTLFVGPRHQALEDRAFTWAKREADDGIGRVLYIVGNKNRQDRVLGHWAESYPRLTLRVETLTGLVYECHEKIEGPGAQVSDQRSLRAIEFGLDQILTDHPWLSPGTYASAELADSFDRRFARFENVGLNTPDRVREEFRGSPLNERIRDTTVDAYERFYDLRQAAAEPWQFTRSQAFETVAEANLTELLPHVDAVVISDFMQFGEVEKEAVRALAEAFPMAAVLPTFSTDRSDGVDVATTDAREVYDSLGFDPEWVGERKDSLQRAVGELYRDREPDELECPTGLDWRELPTPEREVRYVARELRLGLDAGLSPAELGVIIPGLQAYDGYVEDVFETYDLPYAIETGTSLSDTFVGSAVTTLLALADDDPRASELTELVTNPVVQLVDDNVEDEVVAAERRVDSPRLGAVLEQLSPEVTTDLEESLSVLGSLRDSDLGQAVDIFREQMTEIGVTDALGEGSHRFDEAEEHAALDKVETVLDSFESDAIPETDLPPTAALLRAFENAAVDQYSDSTDRIVVMDHREAEAFSFEQVFVVGLTADYFPVVARYPAFFERMEEEHPKLQLVDDRLRDRYLFATLIANSESVTLTTPSTDVESTAVVRSPVLDELSRVTGIEPETGVDTRVGSREDLQRAISPLGKRRAALDAAGDRGDFSATQTIRADRGTLCAAHRRDPGLSPYDGVLEPETVAEVYPEDEREPYSASRIERYVNCGFQFYMEHVLEMEDEEYLERTPDPLETGTFVHDTLERFFADLQDEPGDGVDIQQYERSNLESHMLEVALEELDSADLTYSGLFYRRWLEQLFAGLGQPSENPYYGDPRPHSGVERGLFVRFVDREYRRNSDTLPAWFEAPFGQGLAGEGALEPFEIDLPNGEKVSLRGYIDRVDIGMSDNGASIELFDYKTGYAPSMTKTTGGTTFQLPIYLLAAEAVLAENIEDVTDLSATYYQVKPPNSLKEPRGIESKFDSIEELNRFLNEELPERLGTLTSAIEQGRFHTTLLGEREAGCDYCAYSRTCDVRHHQRRDRVEILDDDPQTYVPVRATARSFEDEFRGGSHE